MTDERDERPQPHAQDASDALLDGWTQTWRAPFEDEAHPIDWVGDAKRRARLLRVEQLGTLALIGASVPVVTLGAMKLIFDGGQLALGLLALIYIPAGLLMFRKNWRYWRARLGAVLPVTAREYVAWLSHQLELSAADLRWTQLTVVVGGAYVLGFLALAWLGPHATIAKTLAMLGMLGYGGWAAFYKQPAQLRVERERLDALTRELDA